MEALVFLLNAAYTGYMILAIKDSYVGALETIILIGVIVILGFGILFALI